MPSVTFIDPQGKRHTVTVRPGVSLMEAAYNNNVPGIEAQCGGNCACATCHVYIAPDWRAKIGAPLSCEADMLDFTFDQRENSRLSCQIRLTDEHDGLVVTIATRQS